MKKILIVIAAIIMAMSCCMFVGCDKINDAINQVSDGLGLTTAEGTYKFYSVNWGGKTYKVGDKYDNGYSTITFTADFMVVTLEKGGVLKITQDGEEQTGTWEKNENGKYDLIVGGDAQEATISGNTLTLELDTGFGIMTYIVKK